MDYAIGVVACWKNLVHLRESQDELERRFEITESCRSIPNFFSNLLIRYFVPHLDGLN